MIRILCKQSSLFLFLWITDDNKVNLIWAIQYPCSPLKLWKSLNGGLNNSFEKRGKTLASEEDGQILMEKEEIMIQNILKEKWIMVLLLTLFLGGGLTTCATTVKEREQGQPSGETKAEGGGRYYFDDVRVPEELDFKPNESFIYETPRFKAGVLYFSKWRLDVPSLIDFFIYHMEQDNWKQVNIFRGKESFLNFSKPDKTCTIKIFEKWHGSTVVEIRVGPLGERKM